MSNFVSDSPSNIHQPKVQEGPSLHDNRRHTHNNRAPGGNPVRPQSPICNYHVRFGNRVYNCTDPPRPFSNTVRNSMSPTAENPQLHNVFQYTSTDDPLFFKIDKVSGATFLIDTGAANSIFPLSRITDQQVRASIVTSLQTLGEGHLLVLGLHKTRVDIGFSRFFYHDFCVCDMEYGVLGANFLTRHKLIVDLAVRRLTASIEVEQCSRYTDDDRMAKEFVIYSNNESDDSMLCDLKKHFPKYLTRCCENDMPLTRWWPL